MQTSRCEYNIIFCFGWFVPNVSQQTLQPIATIARNGCRVRLQQQQQQQRQAHYLSVPSTFWQTRCKLKLCKPSHQHPKSMSKTGRGAVLIPLYPYFIGEPKTSPSFSWKALMETRSSSLGDESVFPSSLEWLDGTFSCVSFCCKFAARPMRRILIFHVFRWLLIRHESGV